MSTIAQWLAQTVIPRHEARILLCHITGLNHAQVITHDEQMLPENQVQTLNEWLTRRVAGEPIAYLIGQRAFYGRDFTVSPATLIPRPETELLVEAALNKLPENGTVLDLGTGSGIIAISIAAERPDAHVFAGDISQDALKIAQKNAQNHQTQVAFAQGSWFQAAQKLGLGKASCDVIVSNPPYIEQHDPHLSQGDLRFEPRNALTDFADGLSHFHTLANQAKNYLKPQGWLMVEHGYDQATAIHQIFQAAGLQNTHTLLDLAGLDRVTLAQAA
ncbi:MAG: peptide chain release factor N(5)-glutamine methyltransferase [Alysiella sp.]|uniref:peptide chain release factor N(5)-glutamine methyltransferase n=1 Tax=Alysiella sp. TaxID=1872483 RepID=UPI0026DAAB24|nr:peptide chain release factor N(5)-glutamine methyltransferase [Alysiella sp.]MDO4434201.1 peptide chain release factor N(5)-glutamine methyltransferase [Alysiella sp.]